MPLLVRAAFSALADSYLFTLVDSSRVKSTVVHSIFLRRRDTSYHAMDIMLTASRCPGKLLVGLLFIGILLGYLVSEALRVMTFFFLKTKVIKGLLLVPADYAHLKQQNLQDLNALEELELGPTLGGGSYGRVVRGRWKGALVAVKLIRHEAAPHKSNLLVARECISSLLMMHPNHVRSFFVATIVYLGSDVGGSLRTSVVMEICDKGTLKGWRPQSWKFLEDGKPHGWKKILLCLKDVARGMVYLHSLEIIHADLKCDNILLQSSKTDTRGFTLKIADLGCSRLTKDNSAILVRTHGTPFYAAPEVLLNGELTKASDVYAFAIISWFLVSHGDDYFDRTNIGSLYYAVTQLNDRPAFRSNINSGFVRLIQACWQTDAALRPSFEEIYKALDEIV